RSASRSSTTTRSDVIAPTTRDCRSMRAASCWRPRTSTGRSKEPSSCRSGWPRAGRCRGAWCGSGCGSAWRGRSGKRTRVSSSSSGGSWCWRMETCGSWWSRSRAARHFGCGASRAEETMSKRSNLSRRGFLTALGLGSVAAAAPFLRVLRTSAQVEAPTRLLIWYTGNGTLESAWRPSGGERDFTLGPILEPLAPFRDQLLLFGPQRAAAHVREEVGLSIRVNHEEGPSGGHGLAKILTGVVEREFDGTRWAGGPSVDQHIASAIGAPTPFRSLELGI